MSTTCIQADSDDPGSFPKGRVGFAVVDNTPEDMIVLQQTEDENGTTGKWHAIRAGFGQ